MRPRGWTPPLSRPRLSGRRSCVAAATCGAVLRGFVVRARPPSCVHPSVPLQCELPVGLSDAPPRFVPKGQVFVSSQSESPPPVTVYHW